MSSFAQVQTYATCNRFTLPRVLAGFQETLAKLGCTDRAVWEWLMQVTWPTDEDSFGDVYAAPFILLPDKPIECVGLEISLYTSLAVLSIEELPTWVGFNFLFDIEHLKESATAPYKPEIGSIIWRVLLTLFTHFSEVGVYFTDAWQENQAWRALVEGAGEPWVFDLAIFPRNLAQPFSNVPIGFQGTVVEGGFAFALANRWQILPWQDAEETSG